MTNGIYILLGCNLGDKKANLLKAQSLIIFYLGNLLRASNIYETAAWGKTDQPSFYNQVLEIDSDISPEVMLKVINEIEHQMGRIRKEKWGERLIDIDILYYHDKIVEKSDLQIPHIGIPDRRFTLIPLVELSPEFIHPKLLKTNKELLKECSDNLEVVLIK